MRRVLLALIVAACGSESHGNLAEAPRPAIPVQVVTAAPTDLPRVLSAVGTLSSSETTVVSAEITGTVTNFDIPEGRPVESGHLLATLDDAEAQAATAVARARFQSAQNRQDRTSSLRAASVASQWQRLELQALIASGRRPNRAARCAFGVTASGANCPLYPVAEPIRREGCRGPASQGFGL